jgi:hypothetical protein
MINTKGSILAQTLINLVIFALFMHVTFQSIYYLSKPVSIQHLKYDYLQLQLDYLASLYDGAKLINESVCFKEDRCLEFNHHRLILTTGYQILMEDIKSYEIIDHQDSIRIKVNHLNKWVIFDVKK